MEITELLRGVHDCPCGRDHACGIERVEIGEGALAKLPGICSSFGSVVLVADGNTFPLCGERVASLLGDKVAGVCLFGRETVIPDEDAIAKVRGAMPEGCDLLVGIGSGVIQDLCKYVAFDSGIRYVIVATAPSMDGYASTGAAMILDRMKVTVSARVPYAIVAEPEIVATAPLDMIRSGYGDIVGKYSCLNDWKLAHLLRGEYFCPFVYQTVLDTVKAVKGTASALLARDPAAIAELTRALVVVGILMSYVGNSRPASGSEHHLSHFFEITGLLTHSDYFLHGIDVLYSAAVTAGLRGALLSRKPPFTDRSVPEGKRNEEIRRVYPGASDGVIALQRKVGLYAECDADLLSARWDAVCDVLRDAPDKGTMLGYIEAIGLDISDFVSHYGKEKITDAIRYAKDLKDRYTVLWLCWILGVTDWNN